ncbi:ATPase family AAA domain-containing protein 2-like isoform X5 [Sebastes umbrosus]|uniref:ATPase family AAA domain-containing protein 2-like isoform X5 n=1 Tax=Sebastes umbrosus TaxID=72105 RepID=UPI0018A0F75D|nr:ATPase family AAA domain-containing protein 2-like isoform X5 [Sebastes umbrosus]
MVMLRGRGREDPDQRSGSLRQQRPAKNSQFPQRARAETRSRSTVHQPDGVYGEDDEQNHVDSETQEDEDEEAVRFILRKSPRLQSSSGVGRKIGPRRSSRPTKPIRRYQASNMFDGISTNAARSVLTRMDNMKKIRWLSNNKEGKLQKIYSKAQRSRTPVPPQTELSDSEDDNGGVVDKDSRREVAADDDSNCSTDQNFDAKLSRASLLYKGPTSEFPRGTFRISASGANTTRRTAFRPTDRSDEDSDSDDEVQDVGKVPGSSRQPLGPRTEDFLGTRRHKMNAGAGLADIDPMAIDQSVGFDSIGGLSGHISALKEMVVFPLLYPEVFDNFKIQPPRGCLFYGPPGTGKTLVARVLANECSHGNRKVAFFMRKGADCLSKWVGESERQLRLLFEQAYQMRPSIIFFDEIDGLAPVRSSRQDQIHSSIVSTLLALMDGLDNRGEVVVIGATNRLDSIDPGLRRPGRFDREFLFGLPDRESRKEILKIHTRQWKPRPSEDFLDELAEKCVGYCGADIRAVCTEAALCALRRRYPQIYSTSQKLLLDVSSIAVSSCDFVVAMKKMVPASHRVTASPAKPLYPEVQPLLAATLRDILDALQRLFPHAEQGMKREPDLTSGIFDQGPMCGGDEGSSTSSISTTSTSKSKNFLHFARSAVKHPTSHRPRMLLAGRPGSGQTSHLAPAILHALERFVVNSLDSAVLFGVSSTSPEEACVQVFCEARRTSPSILYMPHIQQWWETAGSSLRASFLSLLSSIPSLSPILLLATCSVPLQQLDPEIQSLFWEDCGEIYTIGVPNEHERTDFFQDLILNQAAEAPSKNRALTRAMEILPLAPLPPPRQLPKQERLRVQEREEDVMRELRLFLRNVTERLSLDRRFKAFSKPVDTEEVPDYVLVVKKPMDFSTLLTNIDVQKYVTVSEFMSDVDLIWQNALEYNPDSDPMDRHIRHRAYALKDTVRAIMRDELNKEFEGVCEEIRESRYKRASSCGTEANPEEADGVCSSAFTRNSPGPRQHNNGGETRANMAALEQMQLFKSVSSVEILDEETRPLVVNHSKLRDLLSRAVVKTERCEVEMLEKFYALLAQCIYRHRNNHNKTALLQEMKKAIDSFS